MKFRFIANKKGFSTLIPAMFAVVLVAVITITLYTFLNLHILLNERREEFCQNYYNAEFGAYRAKWLLDGDYIMLPYNDEFAIPDSGGDTVDIAIVYNSIDDYHTITAKSGDKTITARYEDGRITSWD